MTHVRPPLKLFLSGLLVLACGCSTTLLRDTKTLARDPGRLVGKPKIEKDVSHILTLWEPSTGVDPSGKPARGFAGQILFFGHKQRIGGRVHGTVVITQYADYDPESLDEITPLHSFTFEPDAWDVHRTDGTLGQSYSCFIPFMSERRDQVNCGLKVELIMDDGTRVSSQTVEVLLPSRSASKKAAELTRGFVREEQIVGNVLRPEAPREIPAVPDDQPESERRLDSVTIPLPKR